MNMVDIPFAMSDASSQAYFSAGVQMILGLDALAFARNRKINGGDFTRSFHQGVLIQAAHAAVGTTDIIELPNLVKTLYDWTWTNMEIEDVFTLAATGFLIDPTTVGNLVLPGVVRTRSGQSVVLLDEARMAEVFEDLADGAIAPE